MTYVIQDPFHGDPYLPQMARKIIGDGAACFVETGSFYGITIDWMARSFPVECFSCDIDFEHYSHAKSRLNGLNNVTLRNEDSPELLNRLVDKGLCDISTMFWIDAHGYGFDWPLLEEMTIIARSWRRAYVVVDDFLVPGSDSGYDTYNGQECSYEYIKNAIRFREHHVWYPTYSRPDDMPREWFRGWGLITFGVDNFDFMPGEWTRQVI